MDKLINYVSKKDSTSFVKRMKEKLDERTKKAIDDLKSSTFSSLNESDKKDDEDSEDEDDSDDEDSSFHEGKKEVYQCIKSFRHENHQIKKGIVFEGSLSLKMIFVSEKNVIEYGSSSEFLEYWKRK